MGDRLYRQQIDLVDYKTSYLEGGDAANSDAILFLHGWGMTPEPYRESLELLCQRYRVIAPDLPGFGQSHHPNYLPDYLSYVAPLVSLLDALNLSNVHVVGHSGGGAVAIALAATIPSRVSSLVISGSTGIPLGAFSKVFLWRVVELILEIPTLKPVPMLRFVQALLYNSIFKTQNSIQSVRLAFDEDLRSLLPQIQAPTLVLWGGGERFIPVQLACEFSEQIPDAQLMLVEGEHHEWAMFRPHQFVSPIINFLNQVEQNRVGCGMGNLNR